MLMDCGDIFIKNLLAEIKARGLTEAELSVKAGLNRRAVTDLREGRVKSPKLSTVFQLSEALNRDPGEMMGLGPRLKIQADLAHYLEQYSEKEQELLLTAFRSLSQK